MAIKVASRAGSATLLSLWRPVNAGGRREVLGVKVATGDSKEARSVFFANLVARRLSGVELVRPTHTGLVETIAANVPGAGCEHRSNHYAADLMSVCP